MDKMKPLLLVDTPHGYGLAKKSPFEKMEVTLFVPVAIGESKRTAKLLMYKEKLTIVGCVLPEEYYEKVLKAIMNGEI